MNNENEHINFSMFYVDEKEGFGFEVIRKETLKRKAGFKTIEEARQAGFEAAKEIIRELKEAK